MMTFTGAQQKAETFIKSKAVPGWQHTLHVYKDAKGNICYFVVRLDPPAGSAEKKEFRPLYHDGQQWVVKMPDFPEGRPLYNLPAIARYESSRPVWVVEGEKCADCLIQMGAIATTSGGSGTARKTDWTPLAGRIVYIWPDNDAPGLAYAREVTRILLERNCTVKWVSSVALGLQPKEDCVDFFQANPDVCLDQIERQHLVDPSSEPSTLRVAAEALNGGLQDAAVWSSSNRPCTATVQETDAASQSRQDPHDESFVDLPNERPPQAALSARTKTGPDSPPDGGAQPSAASMPMRPDAWEPPLLFDEIETPEIPARLLPGIFHKFGSALAEATETPQTLTTMLTLGALSAALATRFVVEPKRGWKEPINVYVTTALPPANNKSIVSKEVTRPLVDWEKEQAERLEPEIQRLQSRRKTEEKAIESLRGQIAKAADALKRQQLIDEVCEMETNLAEIPSLPQLFATDVTPESLTQALVEQSGRFAILGDEGGIFEVMSGLYSGGNANIDILLKGIDGGDIRVRRRDRSISLNPFITISLAVQPAILQNMGRKRAFSGNGMLERFLYAVPQSRLGYRTHNKPAVPEPLKQAYSRRFKELLALQPAVDEAGAQRPHVLRLAPEAFAEWRAFQDQIEVQLRPGGRLNSCLGWGGKICGYALRIAGLLHVAEYGDGTLTISASTMARALEIAALLTEHALAAFNLMGVEPSAEDAQAVLQWIRANHLSEFSQRECHRALHGRFTKLDRLIQALQVLIDRHIISLPTQHAQTAGKRKSTVFQVNPLIFTGEA